MFCTVASAFVTKGNICGQQVSCGSMFSTLIFASWDLTL